MGDGATKGLFKAHFRLIASRALSLCKKYGACLARVVVEKKIVSRVRVVIGQKIPRVRVVIERKIAGRHISPRARARTVDKIRGVF